MSTNGKMVACFVFINILIISSIGVNSSQAKSAVYLTPLIESGRIAEARLQAKVELPNAPKVESYSGYLTINNKTGSNIFFWFFPSKNTSAPVDLWLQGGPGGASTFGLFNEIGPYQLESETNVTLREYPWTNLFSVLFIDQPVGTGFSYTEDKSAYVKNQSQVAHDLFQALVQFFALFPELKPNDFYISGESYAGKYIPAIGYKLHQEKESSGINLKGMAIGNGLVDGSVMFTKYSDLLYQLGIFDHNLAEIGKDYEEKLFEATQEERWLDAYNIWNEYFAGVDGPSFFRNVTGLNNLYDFTLTSVQEDLGYISSYLNLAHVKEAIHVGDRSLNPPTTVFNHLKEDICKSVSHWLEELIDNGYQVLLYSGSLDIIVATSTTQALIQNLKWIGAQRFHQSPRKIWRLAGETVEVAGYTKSYENFHFAVIRNAGHMVPYDQPKAALELITKFVNNDL